jgi:deoxyribodipyrimidine photo-lyase
LTEPVHIVWFRQDLRLADNPALAAASSSGRVLPIYILDDCSAGDWKVGAASRAWLHHSLAALNQSLHGKLQLFIGDADRVIASLTETLSIDSFYWNRCYEPWRTERDAKIEARLAACGINARSFNASLLWEPWTVAKSDGNPYRVFTPFYQNGCLSQPSPRHPLPPPKRLCCIDKPVAGSVLLSDLDLLPRSDWYRSLIAGWEIGETAACARLEAFCGHGLKHYRAGRDFPALDATSRLSPHLHFGEISPQQAWHRAEQAALEFEGDGTSHFRRELGWREFSYHLLYHFPRLPEENFHARFDRFEWLSGDDGIDAWRRGMTGYPIVDAGMRELWQTGYMHNRVRMIVASFLVKNMLIHWRSGENWFWDCLVDADLASNSASWQWVAGSGADAAPYFRIFNPVLQSEKFDPAGDYLLRYCPELAGLPARYRHKPWLAGEQVLAEAGIELGIDYPAPILDLKTTRDRALDRFRKLS